MKTKNYLIILVFIIFCIPNAKGWPGMPTPQLHVDGRDLKDPCGNKVILHGVAITPSPWFNGGSYGIWRWNDYDVQGCLTYNKAVMDKLTDTSDGWNLNYIRLHIDPYWTNDPGPSIGENNISRFNYNRLVTYTDQVIIPLINHAKERGMYVILRPPGVCPDRIAVNDNYHNYLKTVWTFLSKHPSLKNSDHVMFELANEPIEILGTNGVWGQNSQAHFDALKNFFQPLVNIIRNNGANNICWIPGTGWQSRYAGYANNPITGGNIGYAVHVYPGYWGAANNYQSMLQAWNSNIKPIADIAPIAVTEVDWAPEGYGTWGTANTGTAGGDGFGANFNHITFNSGNVSWNVLSPENLIHQGNPNGGTAYGNNWQACAAPVKHWFSEFAQSNIPSTCNGGSTIGNGTYNIVNRNSGLHLDSYNLGTSDGTNVVQWAGTNQNNQKWILTALENGYYRISPAHSSNLALDVTDFSSDDGANVQLWTYWGNECQQWKLIDVGNGYYQIQARHSNQLLEVAGASTTNGGNVQQWPANNHHCQHWLLQRLKSSSQNDDNLEARDSNDNFQISPNPSNGNFNIYLEDISEDTEVEISVFNLNGQKLFSTQAKSDKVMNVKTQLTSGIYLIVVKGPNKISSQKLMIE